MVEEIILSKSKIRFITDYKGLQNFDTLLSALKTDKLELEENICIFDMDAKTTFSENQQDFCKGVICISALWTFDKYIRAWEHNCRAFLNTTSLVSINEILELVSKNKTVVFDESVASLIRNLL